MTSLTTIDIQRTERLVSVERKRTAKLAAWMAFTLIAAGLNLVGGFALQDNMAVVRIFNVAVGFMMLGGFVLAVLAFLDAKLKHAELLAELTHLRTLHDKGY